MNKVETAKIIAVLKISGVDFKATDEMVVSLWVDIFKEDKYEDVNIAIKKLLKQEKQLFVNGLIAKIKDLLVPEDVFLDSTNAWNEVRQAMHDSHPDVISETQKAWDSLSPLIQKVLGNAHTLIEWEYETSTDDLNTVIKSNFIREYNNLCRIYKDDLKNGGKMLESLGKPKGLENREKSKLSNNANLRTNLEFLLSTNLDKKIVGKLNKTGILIVLFSIYEVFKLNGNKYPYEEKYTYDFFRKYSITRDLEFEKERFKDNEEFINFVDVMCFKSKQENEKR